MKILLFRSNYKNMKLFKNWSTLNAGQHLKMLQRRPPEASVLSNILFTPSPTLYTPFHNHKDLPTSFYIGLAHCTAMKCNILPRQICCQRGPYIWKYVQDGSSFQSIRVYQCLSTNTSQFLLGMQLKIAQFCSAAKLNFWDTFYQTSDIHRQITILKWKPKPDKAQNTISIY